MNFLTEFKKYLPVAPGLTGLTTLSLLMNTTKPSDRDLHKIVSRCFKDNPERTVTTAHKNVTLLQMLQLKAPVEDTQIDDHFLYKKAIICFPHDRTATLYGMFNYWFEPHLDGFTTRNGYD